MAHTRARVLRFDSLASLDVMSVQTYTPHHVHTGVVCDGCHQTPIAGTRHRCLFCLDVDFCSECVAEHEHQGCFLVLREPVHLEWIGMLRMMTCVPTLLAADEGTAGGDSSRAGGFRAPPPDGLHARFVQFVEAGAEKVCTDAGYSNLPDGVPSFATMLELNAKRRQHATLKLDQGRKRKRLAKEARRDRILDPHYFVKINETRAPPVPSTSSSSPHPSFPGLQRFEEKYVAYRTKLPGGAMCLVSDVDGMPVATVQVFAVGNSNDASNNDSELVPSSLIRADIHYNPNDNHPAPNPITKMFALFGAGNVEVRMAFTNLSEKVGPVRMKLQTCDARGFDDGNTTFTNPIFDKIIQPLESVEMVCDNVTGRALLLNAAQQVISGFEPLTSAVSLQQELNRALENSIGTYLKVSVAPCQTWSGHWDKLQWHCLETFIAPRRVVNESQVGGGLFGAGGGAAGLTFRAAPSFGGSFGGASTGGSFSFGAPSAGASGNTIVPSLGAFVQRVTFTPPPVPTTPVLGTVPRNTQNIPDVEHASVAKISLGRETPNHVPQTPPPQGYVGASTALSFVFGFGIEENIKHTQVESDEQKLRNANELLAAAKDSRLVPLYEQSVATGHTSDSCLICLESTTPADLILLPCKHQCMHSGCMREQLTRCPLCRTKVEWTLGKEFDGRLTCRPVSSETQVRLGPRAMSRREAHELGITNEVEVRWGDPSLPVPIAEFYRNFLPDQPEIAEAFENNRERNIGRGTTDIGEWLPVDENSAGNFLLLDPSEIDVTPPTQDTVTAICENAAGPPPPATRSALPQFKRKALTSTQCSDVIQRIETEAACNLSDDFKFEVTDFEATTLVGRKTLENMVNIGTTLLRGLSFGNGANMKIKLRKRAAVSGSERCVVPFHRDTSLVVVNVALNDDFEGGKLLYVVCDENEEGRTGKQSESKKLFVAERREGDITAHDCTMVHGVSRLVLGVRYNMYVVWEATTSVAA